MGVALLNSSYRAFSKTIRLRYLWGSHATLFLILSLASSQFETDSLSACRAVSRSLRMSLCQAGDSRFFSLLAMSAHSISISSSFSANESRERGTSNLFIMRSFSISRARLRRYCNPSQQQVGWVEHSDTQQSKRWVSRCSTHPTLAKFCAYDLANRHVWFLGNVRLSVLLCTPLNLPFRQCESIPPDRPTNWLHPEFITQGIT
jgi:hypothetical protein